MVEWGVKVISSPFSLPEWDVRALEPVELRAEWKVFFRSAVNWTMPPPELDETVQAAFKAKAEALAPYYRTELLRP
jgi:hypothetical protein